MKFNKKDQLLFLPLGGCNEIGLNVNLFQYKGKWLMLDLGAGFADEWHPGVDMLAPDLTFAQTLGDDFLGVLLTHAHEDHLGGLPYVWYQLKCPVYATPFTAAIAKSKMRQTQYYDEFMQNLTILQTGGEVEIGPFNIDLVHITHSIPEMNGAVIKTEYGNIVHTGDWKLDPNPVLGPVSDEATLKKYGDEGVLAMTCDSTNVFSPGHSGSEGKLKETISKIIAGSKGLVAVTTFASNAARVETISRAAMENGRKVVLAGRSLWTYTEAARESGYFKDIPEFMNDRELKKHRREDVVVICTGCQGEGLAAMNKVVSGTHPTIRLTPEDTVIFSSKIIPGNEKRIFRMFNMLVKLGIDVYEEKDHDVHVSGHPNREELKRMYELVRPQISVPVHGEPVHLHEHAKLAKSLGVKKQFEMENGRVLKLAPGVPEIIGQVQAGHLCVDAQMLLHPDGAVMKRRRRLQKDGIVIISIAVAKKGGIVTEPTILAPGLMDEKESRVLLREISEELMDHLNEQRNLSDDKIVRGAKSYVRKVFDEELGKRPSNVEVIVTRV
jgi:ribonuclease J